VRLWMLLNVAVWHALYMDEESPETIAARLTATAGRLPAGQAAPARRGEFPL